MNTRQIKFIRRFFAIMILLALLAALTPVAYAAPVDSSGGRSYHGQFSGDGRFADFSSVDPRLVPLNNYEAQSILLAIPGGMINGLCESWANACELRYALTIATSGQAIWAAAGTYKPTIGIDRSATFQLKTGVALYGGFAGTETGRDQRNPATNVTILSGDLKGDDVGFTNNSENVYHVVSGASGATLDGFTIKAGNANGNDSNLRGGGLYNSNGSAPTLMNITFSGNSASTGGGMDNDSSNPTLINVTFSGNSANLGGGMNNRTSNPTLTNVTFSGNSASYGGGMYNNSGSPTMTNVTFTSNVAGWNGGGMENTSSSYPIIRNTIFWGNTAATDEASQIHNDSSIPVLSDSVVKGGCPVASTCTNIIITDPLPGTLGNYSGFTQTIPLLTGSSAINTGNNITCAAIDQRGITRPQGAQCDIGAYELIIVDIIAPIVTSITRVNTNPTNLASVSFSIIFSESVTAVDITDFVLTVGGGVTAAEITGVSGAGKDYIVSINTGNGDGTLRLDVIDDGSIQDLSLNSLGGVGAGNGNFNSGDPYTLNKSIPITTTIVRVDPSPAVADNVHFTVSFNEEVSGIDVSDFIPVTTGNLSGATVAEVIGAGNTYTVTLNIGIGDGTLRLDILDDDSIADVAANRLGGNGTGNGNFSAGDVYLVEKSIPAMLGILRADSDPTAADTVNFIVTFSEAVSGVDAGDFILTTTNSLSGASFAGLSGSANTYIVTVSTGSGVGNLRLDLIDNDSIVDSVNHPLGGLGAGNGNFTTGEVYSINKPVITILSEIFRSNGTNDGWILESNENSSKGGSKNSNAITFNLGDDLKNRMYRSILHFPTDHLPDNAVVTQVILMIKRQGAVGTDPFTTHQNISIDIRSGVFGGFGPFGFGGLQISDFQAPASKISVGVIQNNPIGNSYWSVLDVTAYPLINRVGLTQLRLGFQINNNDRNNGYLKFFSGNYEVLKDRPQLLVKYYAPK